MRTLAVGFATAICFLLGLNALFIFVRKPNISRTADSIRYHDWHDRPGCSDISASCDDWVLDGRCRWDSTTQRLCPQGCDRCSGPRAVLLGVNANVEVSTVNQIRLRSARVDPQTCQHSSTHSVGAALRHRFTAMTGSAGVTSVQAACRFEALPLDESAAGSCTDAAPGCQADAGECLGDRYTAIVVACRRTCGFCQDEHDNCAEWGRHGQCTGNPVFMMDSCPRTCGGCGEFWDPSPPAFAALWNGLIMPTVGFGTAGLGDGASQAVGAALDVGYRLLDSAQAPEWYREDLNGQALRAGSVPRDEVFITTKIHPKHLGYDATLAAFESSLSHFGTEYIDLLLLHYPACWGTLCSGAPAGSWRDSWRALEMLVQQGKVLAIGVSNFDVKEVLELLEWAVVPPAVVQRRNDLFAQDAAMRRLCLAAGVRYQGYSSLGTQYARQGYQGSPVLSHPGVLQIAARRGVTPAQVVLKHAAVSGILTVPRSTSRDHMQQSLQLHDVHLDKDEVAFLNGLDGRLPARPS